MPRRQLLLMLDEFPALGRLDFFETALAFMAGYGVRAFLISQSLNQIAKAYGDNNSILDNCHVRIAFATNDERTAKRISDALGTATEQRSMRNYAGHRLAPWLAHVMVSRQETSRPLLTPGEVMQLPPTEEIVLVSGMAPIRASKLRYFEDCNFTERLLPAPLLADAVYGDRPSRRGNDWEDLVRTSDWRLEPVGAESAGGEGRTRERRPPLAPKRRRVLAADSQLDFLAEDERDGAPMLPDKGSGPGALVGARAMNEGSGRDFPIPSF